VSSTRARLKLRDSKKCHHSCTETFRFGHITEACFLQSNTHNLNKSTDNMCTLAVGGDNDLDDTPARNDSL